MNQLQLKMAFNTLIFIINFDIAFHFNLSLYHLKLITFGSSCCHILSFYRPALI